jgi:hypothetical protein
MGVGRLIDTEAILRLTGAAGAAWALACALAMLGPAATRAEVPSTVDATSVVTDGPVYAIARAGGRTFLGGDFDHAGPRTGPGVPFALSDASTRPFPEISGGEVDAVIPDGGGGWYVGGTFQYVAGVARPNLAHVASDGSLDQTFAPNPNGPVFALAMDTLGSHTTLYAGGQFSRIGAAGRSDLAALDPTTGQAVASFAASIAGAGGSLGSVNAISVAHVTVDVSTGDPPQTSSVEMPFLAIGGDFVTLGGQTVNRLGAVWGRDAAASTTDPVATSIAGQPVRGSAKDTPPWTPNPCPSSGPCKVSALALGAPALSVSSGTRIATFPVYAGGVLASPLGAWKLAIRQNGSGAGTVGTDTAGPAYDGWWSPPSNAPDGTVRALALVPRPAPLPPLLLLGGDFTTLGATSRSHLAAVSGIDATGAGNPDVQSWSPAADGPVSALALGPGGAVFAGGSFTHAGGGAHTGVAALSLASDQADPSWDAGLAAGDALALASDGGSLFVGGTFRSAHAVDRRGLYALNPDGGIDAAWHPDAGCSPAPCSAAVRTLLADGSDLYAGGDFTSVGGQPRAHLAALDGTSGDVRAFAPDPDGPVLALAKSVSLFVGGAFSHIGPPSAREARADIAAVDPATGSPSAFGTGNLGANDVARSLDASCSAVYVGGSFTSIGGQPRNRIAALDPASGVATAWNPDADSTVLALDREGETVFTGGNFSIIGGQPRQKLAALDATTGKAGRFNPSGDGTVRAIAMLDGALYAGGSFAVIGDASRNRLAALDPLTGDATPWNPNADAAVYALSSAGGALIAGGAFRQVGTAPVQGVAPFGTPTDDVPSRTCSAPNVPSVPTPAAPDATPAPVTDVSAAQPALGGSDAGAPPPASGIDAKRLRIGAMRISGSPPVLTLTLSADATVRVLLARRRRPGSARCASCKRFVPAGSSSHQGRAGENHVVLTGRHGRRLGAARYRATVIARAGTGTGTEVVRRIIDFQVGARSGR